MGHIGAALDKETRTVAARIEVANADGRLKPEMFATRHRSTVAGAAREVIALPEAAIVLDAGAADGFRRGHGALTRCGRSSPASGSAGASWSSRASRPGEQVVTAGVYALKARKLKSQLGQGHEEDADMLNAIVDAVAALQGAGAGGFAVLVGLGVQAFRQVPVDAFPDVTPAQVNIYTESPGVAAEDVERLLTVPIEGAMAGLANVEVSPLGLAVRPVLRRRVLRRRRRHLLRAPAGRREAPGGQGRLPEGYGEPVLGPNSSGLGQVFWYTIEDADEKLSAMDLRTLHDWTVRLILRTAPGVDDVTTWGGTRSSSRC